MTRTWTATDLCGLTSTHQQIITVIDTTVPTFTSILPEDKTVECDAIGDPVILTATDTCGTATVSFTEVTSTDNNCENSYTLTRTWTATDLCGLTSTHQQIITVIDTTAPTFTSVLPDNKTVECDAINEPEFLTATDTCGTAIVSFTEVTSTDNNCENNYTLTRTWTATDLCGLTTTHQQIITVIDTTAPTFTSVLPDDKTVECDAIGDPVILTATDTCGTAIVSFTEVTSTDSNCENNYTLTRTWTATDLCGLTSTHQQIITVIDTTAPTFTSVLPEDKTVECDAIGDAEIVTATDTCGTAIVSFTEVTSTDNNCENNYTLTRTWTATDLCGLTSTHQQIITVIDTTAPEFSTEPTDYTANCDTVTMDFESWIATNAGAEAYDNCSNSETLIWTTEIVSSSTDCGTTYVINFKVTDSCGNSSSKEATYQIIDSTPPSAIDYENSEITVSCGDIPEIPDLKFMDACSNELNIDFSETLDSEQNSGNGYTITRIWNVSDNCNNSAIYEQIIHVSSGVETEDFISLCIVDDLLELSTLLPSDFETTNGTWEAVSASDGFINGNEFDPSIVNLGNYQMIYNTNNECNDRLILNINVNDDCEVLGCTSDIKISKVLTPNNDGHNDYFNIENIDECNFTVHLKIFNRWGKRVYTSNNYKNTWNGHHDNSGMTIGNNSKLPSGTYYYIIHIENQEFKPLTGYIYLGNN